MRNPQRRRRRYHRNPLQVRGIVAQITSGLAIGLGAFGGYAAVKTLDGLYTMPFGQTMTIPGTTATLGDTLQSVVDATLVTVGSAMLLRRARGAMLRKAAGGIIAGAWLSVIHDLVASWTSAPSWLSSSLSGYPRGGMGAIAPGSTYMPALTAGPRFNPMARMAGYPGAHIGM
jgi:hypothetical protein